MWEIKSVSKAAALKKCAFGNWCLLDSVSDREATSVIIALVLWVNKIFVLWPAVFGTLNIGSICEEKKNEILRKVKLYNDVVFSH